MNNATLEQAMAYYGLAKVMDVALQPKGLVNITHTVETINGCFVFQKLNSIFDERVIMDNIEITRYLKFRGMNVPQLIETPAGSLYFRKHGSLWKVSEYIPHDPTIRPNPGSIGSAAAMLARFHRIMEECVYVPKYSIPDFHATRIIVKKLGRVFKDCSRVAPVSMYTSVYEYILQNIKQHYLPTNVRETLIHGDPKFDNFLFGEDGKAVALIDFDTIMTGSRFLDIGDAFRSWCRVDRVKFDTNVFRSALEAYNSETNNKVSADEARNATALITLELAARFLIDCFEESYFEWDSKKYDSSASHNLVRAEEMVKYHKSICG